MSDIAENRARKCKPCYPVLMNRMRTCFHKHMCTTFIHHLFQQRIQS